LKVSSHFLIERTGILKQFVSTNNRAWHAGESSFQGKNNCNDFSIGIELEGTDSSVFEDIQYSKLIELTRTLMQNYPKISKERIVGHSFIAPGRKSDPGIYFDWKNYKSEI
jgi:AmpD protein